MYLLYKINEAVIFVCDTMVALSNSTSDGSVIFAKNSDREPNEPHLMIRIPRKKYRVGGKVKCTYIEIEQAEETYEVMLLKPSWMWGCEMGFNEYGLNIGNEAVFTKEKYGMDSLLGMDMIRIALERCKTSDQALDMIIDLLKRYGQGGNCGYKKKAVYHNSFLIADKSTAWVLETAGEYWAAQRVVDIRSISNCLTIGSKFDRCHPELIKHAVDKGWCSGESDFNFAKCYTNPIVTRFSRAWDRYKASTAILGKEKGIITVDTMKNILRHHDCRIEGKQNSMASLKSICMHGGHIIGSHTTGSFISSLSDKVCTYWITGASTPCLSVFKPFWLMEGENLSFKEEEEEAAVKYWRKREILHRYIMDGRVKDVDSYIIERDGLEKDLEERVALITWNSADECSFINLIRYAADKEEQLIERTLNESSGNPRNARGNLYFRHYWKKQNSKL